MTQMIEIIDHWERQLEEREAIPIICFGRMENGETLLITELDTDQSGMAATIKEIKKVLTTLEQLQNDTRSEHTGGDAAPTHG